MACLLYTSFTKKKILHVLKMALFVVALSLILLSLLGTVAHATGLVDDTINAGNLYSKYPLSNYPVSYTHLDVYKRQGGKNFWIFKTFLICSKK